MTAWPSCPDNENAGSCTTRITHALASQPPYAFGHFALGEGSGSVDSSGQVFISCAGIDVEKVTISFPRSLLDGRV